MIEFICSVVIRGGKNPLVVDFTSSIADGSGELLSVLMLTWLKEERDGTIKKNTNPTKSTKLVFILKWF